MLNENKGRSAYGEPRPEEARFEIQANRGGLECYHHDAKGTISPMEAYRRYFDDKKCQHCNLRCVDLVREG